MDLAHFGLSALPFRPSHEVVVLTPVQNQALQKLTTAWQRGDGIATLDGPPGAGKTTIAWKFLSQLDEHVVPVVVPSARLDSPVALLQAMLFDLGLNYQGLSESELRLAVTGYWLQELAAGRRGVLVLDEAQYLHDTVFDEIRCLDNLDVHGRKALFIVLVGLPELRTRLDQPAFAPFRQRVSCQCHLDVLSHDLAIAMVEQELTRCGAPGELFSVEAMDVLVQHAGGVPRVVNRVAALSLEVAIEAGEKTVDVEVVCEACERLGLTLAEPDRPVAPEQVAKSGKGQGRKGGEADEDGVGLSPKQKTRRRRAA